MRMNQEYLSTTERFLKRMLKWTPADEVRRQRSVRRDAAKRSFFCFIFSYLKQLRELSGPEMEHKLFEEVKRFVGTVHILAAANEEVGAAKCVGMVTLLKPDGGCMTAYECVKGTKKKVFVRFEHLQEYGAVTYVVCLETWTSLEPLEPKDFSGCLAVGYFVGSPVTVFCFSSERGEWKLVKAPVLWSCSHLQVLIPTSRLNMVGFPVINCHGLLCGTVTGLTNLEGRRRIEHRWLKKCITTRDLKVLVDSFSDQAVYHDFCVGLKVKQLVDSTWTRDMKFMSLQDEWELKHPMSEF